MDRAEPTTSARYSELVLRRFREPRYAGETAVASGEVAAYVEEGGSGARIRLTATADTATLRALRFRVFGCPHLIAAVDLVCERLEGRPVKEMIEFDCGTLREELDAPLEKSGRFLLLQDALDALAETLKTA